MKRIANNFLTIAALVMLTSTSYAQMAENSELLIVDQKPSTSRPVGLDTRVTIATDQPVAWSHSKYGFAGSYTMGDTHYMATYNSESHYIETYEKIDCNSAEVSSVVKSALLTSLYKDQQVISYWKSSDPTEFGYYLEIKSKSGKQSSVWADDKGNFYNRPFFLEEALISMTQTIPSNGTN
ncbi:MAG TPA: hypothetical protein PLJ60_02085 [Chryseolinea sp.]|nr:hypothetical protein [Chryseolinea sp.]HPM29099.1 hypothetical protein [Chryseolinea sp.]